MAKRISIIGIPMDFGQLLRGVDMGPAAVRYTGLVSRLRALGHTVVDRGDVPIPLREADTQPPAEDKYLGEITQICSDICAMGRSAVDQGDFPLFIGGDHSVAVGTVSAVASPDEATGLIWVDAHGDFNTPSTSPTGNIHGMPLAALIGEGHPQLVNVGFEGAKIKPENVIMIGQRDLDLEERKRIKASGITVFTMREIDEQGISAVASKALMQLVRCKKIHLTVDMDALDPEEAPGVGTPVPGGITYREAHLLMEILADSGKITSMDLVEINPILDVGNKTAELAVELTLSALGQSIL
ncbi:MAG: arginase [Desulfobacterales bacterium]|nr:arginase [Desulfobacterales bacterium]